METKVCRKCNEEKELSEFSSHKGYKDNLSNWCKCCVSKNSKNWYQNNKEKAFFTRKNYKLKNKFKIQEQSRIYNKNNYEKYKKNRSKRFKNDVRFKLSYNLRTRINSVLNGNTKSLNTMFLIGCEIDYLMYHIQCQFKQGMNWDNHGEWHIDHKRPCASFDLSDPEEQRKCFNYTNLQPLWAEENLKKNKY